LKDIPVSRRPSTRHPDSPEYLECDRSPHLPAARRAIRGRRPTASRRPASHVAGTKFDRLNDDQTPNQESSSREPVLHFLAALASHKDFVPASPIGAIWDFMASCSWVVFEGVHHRPLPENQSGRTVERTDVTDHGSPSCGFQGDHSDQP
jgi:hypothetical protein